MNNFVLKDKKKKKKGINNNENSSKCDDLWR